jgi:hypothetical protein
MEELFIAETQDTPQINFNRHTGIFEISGRSLPEDTVDFYTPVLNWLEQYGKSPNPKTDFHIRLEYFNTASSKMILDLLHVLKGISGTQVTWHYYEDDEAIDEAGHEYAEQVDIPFVFEVIS